MGASLSAAPRPDPVLRRDTMTGMATVEAGAS